MSFGDRTSNGHPVNGAEFGRVLWIDGDMHVLRVLSQGKRPPIGYFADPQEFERAAAAHDGRRNAYMTLNPVNPDLLERAKGHLRSGVSGSKAGDIVARRRFAIDVDPVRSSGISATDADSAGDD